MESTKLFRCTVLSIDQSSAEEFAKWLTESEGKEGFFSKSYSSYNFKVYTRWPNFPKGLPTAPANDALIVRIRNDEEWAQLREYVQERGLIQLKVLVWDKEVETVEELLKPTIVTKISEKKNTELLDELIKADKEVENLLLNVFKNFDKSGDGFINLWEIETICRELGIDDTQSDFQETLRSLDVNHDNQISFEEFVDWYKNGRQCSKLMENLIVMRIATNSLMKNLINSKYLSYIKEKVDVLNKEKRELINSFISVNVEKVNENPNLVISLDGYFGGEFKETLSKSYVQNFEEGLKSTDIFIIFEFMMKDSSNIDKFQKFLTHLTDAMRESFRNISRRIFSLINNEISIKVIKKNSETICLSFKLRKVIKEDLLSVENAIKSLLDDDITQKISFSFCMSGDVHKVKQNPNASFVDSLNPAASIQLKTELLKKNIKFLKKSLKPIPRFLKFWLNSYSGSHIVLNFSTESLKTQNSIFQQQNILILQFLKQEVFGFLQDFLANFGGFSLFKKFYDSVRDSFTVVVNTPQFHVTSKIDFSGLVELFD
jgi:hypothetical protein